VRTILILAVNPKGTNRLRIGEEVKKIEQRHERAKNREQFRVVPKLAVTDEDLRWALLNNKPEVVHFAGHGMGDGQGGTGRDFSPAGDVDAGGLVFEDDAGNVRLISGDALAGLFRLCSDSVKCVVLNACYSEVVANAITPHIAFVVGMKKALGDPAAIKFAIGFYDALFAERDFEQAFEFGRSAIDLNGIPEHLTPILKKNVSAVTVAPKGSVFADGPSTSEDNFDPSVTEVAKAVRSKLDEIKDGKVRDENNHEVGLLTLVSREVGAGSPSSGQDLSEHLASLLTEWRDIEHVGLLVWRVFDLLCSRGKKAEAQIIGDVVDLMLPLCLPRDVLSEAWKQLQDHGAVLIQSSVARKAGAEILVAGLYRKATRWAISSPEPAGEHLVGFEEVPIGDPDQSEEVALRDLYIATFYPDYQKKGTSPVVRLTPAQMRDDLSGHYRSRRLGLQRPSYCAVQLAASENDRQNQIKLLSKLAIPHLLFIELKPDSKTRQLEAFVVDCLNTRLRWVVKGFSE
jgi:hypothetical protein